MAVVEDVLRQNAGKLLEVDLHERKVSFCLKRQLQRRQLCC